MALFGFPDPVNETSARLVAAGVVVECVVYLVVREWWLLIPLAFGFVARVASGPRFSPLGRLVTGVITPALARRSDRSPRLVPGPPKRFAQGIGAVFSVAALVAAVVGAHIVAIVLIAGLTVAASLEAFLGVCLGCIVFARLMRWGLIPASVCEACNDLSGRLASTSPR